MIGLDCSQWLAISLTKTRRNNMGWDIKLCPDQTQTAKQMPIHSQVSRTSKTQRNKPGSWAIKVCESDMDFTFYTLPSKGMRTWNTSKGSPLKLPSGGSSLPPWTLSSFTNLPSGGTLQRAPPLCSVCKHNVPHLSNGPRKFMYSEIDRATNGFAQANFLAAGGFGPVYKGVLPDGQVIAVKQHKHLSAQGASEFCSEIEVLSCAQHKNLVRLVGYCIETEWLLVYEFACNGSLDRHLFGNEGDEVMAWHNRMKVAKGAARGLRYLHEDCRVGCIIHRDFRPNNILLTHDYEPMVGDFGLARWQADGESAEETRVIGAFGYLAPEYTQTGLVTERADVYAYGIVLLELLSGSKGTEFSKIAGKQFVSDWGLPLLKGGMIDELIDPRLSTDYDKREVELMMHAAESCLSSLPEERPRMSQVLKILDGDVPNTTTSRSVQHAYSHTSNKKEILATMPSMQGRSNSFSVASQPLGIGEAERNHDAFNSEMLVSEEFQAYLHGSLVKFMQNMN